MNAQLEHIDGRLRTWSLAHEAAEHAWPVLIPRVTLRRAGYYESFPQLLMTAAANAQPEAAEEQLEATPYDLSPAVCYHAYAALENQTLTEAGGRVLAARGHCFRNEIPGELKPGRRQVEFQMRELIFIGGQEWIEESLFSMQQDIAQMAGEFAIRGDWAEASDPFFLPKAEALGKARMQKLLKTKMEYCLPDGLAIASINRHGGFFGQRFQIRLAGGQAAHSACVAFGLERWASSLPKA
ncbi:hypothetical protein WJU23_00585 [Prosthecobacter sp. SYSU 5D2]|uniref:hypothetical protein n=1 Tax=Prosthecobacter sp. SYSU 5D2 TaxID=3134134 RepID=UPI0031FEC3DF